jgi:hypothetical protein
MMRSAALGLGAALLLLAGCETAQRTAWQMNLPGSFANFQVDSVRLRVGYLDTILSSGNIRRRIFAPSDDTNCKRMLVEGKTVQWARTEPFGPLGDAEGRCPVVGLGDLEAWRNARGRASTTTRPIQSSRTRYTIVYRDEEYLYAQGGFSIVGLLGWRPGSDQVIALLPRNEVCAAADRNGFASVEFRIAGTPAFSVVTRDGLCPISGILPAEVEGPDFPDNA